MESTQMSFYLDVPSPEEAAELQLALEASGCTFSAVEIPAVGPQVVIGAEGVEFDPDEFIEHTAIRFIIEPRKNPLEQGYEIASMRAQIREMLNAARPADAENILQAWELSHVAPAGPELLERFDMLHRRFASGLGDFD